MTCDEVLKQITDYLSGDLSAPKTKEFEEHLSQCQKCAEEIEGQRSLELLFGTLERKKAPLGLASNIKNMFISGKSTRKNRRVFSFFFVPWTWKIPLEAAAVVLVVFAAMYSFYFFQSGKDAGLVFDKGSVEAVGLAGGTESEELSLGGRLEERARGGKFVAALSDKEEVREPRRGDIDNDGDLDIFIVNGNGIVIADGGGASPIVEPLGETDRMPFKSSDWSLSSSSAPATSSPKHLFSGRVGGRIVSDSQPVDASAKKTGKEWNGGTLPEAPPAKATQVLKKTLPDPIVDTTGNDGGVEPDVMMRRLRTLGYLDGGETKDETSIKMEEEATELAPSAKQISTLSHGNISLKETDSLSTQPKQIPTKPAEPKQKFSRSANDSTDLSTPDIIVADVNVEFADALNVKHKEQARIATSPLLKKQPLTQSIDSDAILDMPVSPEESGKQNIPEGVLAKDESGADSYFGFRDMSNFYFFSYSDSSGTDKLTVTELSLSEDQKEAFGAFSIVRLETRFAQTAEPESTNQTVDKIVSTVGAIVNRRSEARDEKGTRILIAYSIYVPIDRAERFLSTLEKELGATDEAHHHPNQFLAFSEREASDHKRAEVDMEIAKKVDRDVIEVILFIFDTSQE